MNACVINWGYVTNILVACISAGIPSIVAYIIYQNWRNQKASEVVAIEAKNFIVNLSKLQILQMEIHKIIYTTGSFDAANKEIEEFKFIEKLLSDSSVFLGEALTDPIISHKATTVTAQALCFEIDIEKYQKGERALNKVEMIDPHDAKVISDIYLDYALYRKTIK